METDILANDLLVSDPQLPELLLTDRSANRHIVWATSDYTLYGEQYAPGCEITAAQITDADTRLIKPRVTKALRAQSKRTRNTAEVFTPAWICKAQNDLVDTRWFGEAAVFRAADEGSIPFPAKEGQTWQDYVCARRMEITCGEAPYLVNRYDTVTGERIEDVRQRIGLLDRKLRVVNENTDNEADWLVWVKKAYQSTYGFEFQGDNLLLARENLLSAFIENMAYRFHRQPTAEELCQIAEIISWNIWQMDGFTCTVPASGQDAADSAAPCIIRDWTEERNIGFRALSQDHSMPFDAIVGNPPYQRMDGGAKASAMPIYPHFVLQARELQPSCISMIMPARWYTGGKGLDSFRDEVLHDRRFAVLHDFVRSGMCFSNVEIKGGICYFLWDSRHDGKCSIYRHEETGITHSVRDLTEDGENIHVRYFELLSIKNKVFSDHPNNFESIVSSMKPYGLRGDVFQDIAKYHLPALHTEPVAGGYRILGLSRLKREYRYIPSDYPLPKTNMLHDYKVFVTRNYGVGSFGDLPSAPVVAEPGELCTETFVQVGPFRTRSEAEHALTYLRTRFFRALVSLRKQDQGASKAVYRYVPLQDFTENSDIDWTATVDGIDAYLFRKYSLTPAEIRFIESHVAKVLPERSASE